MDILWLGFHLTVLVASYLLFRAARLSLTHFSIPMLLYIYYIMFSFIGIPGIYFGWFTSYSPKLMDSELIEFQWLVDGGGLLLMTLGFFFAGRVLSMVPRSTPAEGAVSAPLRVPLLLFFICVAVFVLYARLLPTIPILDVLSGKSTFAIRLARSQVTNDFQAGRLSYYSWFFSDVLGFVSYYLGGVALRRRDRNTVLAALVSILFALFVSIHTTNKAPLVDYVLGLTGMYFLLRSAGRIPVKVFMWIGLVSYSILSVMFFAFFHYPPGFAVRRVLERTIGGQVTSQYWTLAFVKYVTGYLNGHSFPNPRGILPWEPYLLNRNVSLFMRGVSGSNLIVGSAPAVFWVEVYANFGVIAALLSAFAVGVFVYWVHYRVASGPLTPLRAALIAWTAVFMAKLGRLSINMLLPFPTAFLIVLMVAFLIDIRTAPGGRRVDPTLRNMMKKPDEATHVIQS